MKWLPLIVFALFGYYLVGANFSAKLGIIDDHEIPQFLGSDGRLGLTEIPRVIMSTEVGRFGAYPRYRPSYYTLRVIETALWRDRAFLWYFVRYLLLVLSLYLGWKILVRSFPQLVAYLFVFYAMTLPFWSDIWTRLGPSEIYGVPASLMFVYGMLTGTTWLFALGYMICLGSKENFLFLVPLLLMYLGYRTYRHTMSKHLWLVGLLLLGYTFLIILGIVLGTSAGVDVYGSSISYSLRLLKLYRYKRYIVETRHLMLPLITLLFSLCTMLRATYLRGIKRVSKSPILPVTFSLFALLGVIFSQYLFYDSELPTNMRYDFPAMLLFAVVYLLTVKLCLVIFTEAKRFAPVRPWVYASLALFLGYLITVRGYGTLRTRATVNMTATQRFATQLDLITPRLLQAPERPLVFVSSRAIDYEPIVSVSRYLVARGVHNTFMLVYREAKPNTDPLLHDLTVRLQGVMQGVPDPDHVFTRFSATEEFAGPCYSISFNEPVTYGHCEALTTF